MRSRAWDSKSWQIWPCNKQPEVDAVCSLAAYRMEQIGQPDLIPFFADLVFCYAGWTVDLPASERNHHARRFGLLIHAAEAVERSVAVGLRSSPTLPPEWVRTTVALALLHDCGRLLDIEVSDSSGRVWDPFQDTLWSFARAGQVTYRWIAGRGLSRHESRAAELFRHLLPTSSASLLPPIQQAWYAYVNRDRVGPDHLGIYPFWVAGIVAWADQQSAQDDYFLQKKAARRAPKPQANAPVCYEEPKGGTRKEVG